MTASTSYLFKAPIFIVNCFASSLKGVQRQTENVNTDEDPSGWQPYFIFVDSLREKYAKNEGLNGIYQLIFLVRSSIVMLSCA